MMRSPESIGKRSLTIQSIKSMHIGARRKELQRIEKENIKIAKKIYLIEPEFKAKDLEKYYNKLRYESTNMNKI